MPTRAGTDRSRGCRWVRDGREACRSMGAVCIFIDTLASQGAPRPEVAGCSHRTA
jgi:hypothetical protein